MTVEQLQKQIRYAVKNKLINKDDEIIILGSGDKKSGLILSGFCLPKVKVNLDKMLNDRQGYYGLGVVDHNEMVIETNYILSNFGFGNQPIGKVNEILVK